MNVVPFRSERDIAAAIPAVAAHLRQGGLLAHPTETVYGLGSRPEVTQLQELAALKTRNPEKPFILLVSGREMVEELGLAFNEAAAALAAAFWPGPLTLVLPATGSKLPVELRGTEGGIAVRWTSHAGMERLIQEVGHPITSTSANRSGRPPAVDISALQRDFGDVTKLLALDGGTLGKAAPSTVLDCTAPAPRLVREGAIPRSDLRACGNAVTR